MDYAGAVVEGGVRFFEVALNSKDGLKQISMLRRRCGERYMVGAGTAITVELAKKALEAGAQFLLTPGTPLDVMEYCAKNSVKLLPGVFDAQRGGREFGIWVSDDEAVPGGEYAVKLREKA